MGDLMRHRLWLLDGGLGLAIGSRIGDCGCRGVEGGSGRKLDAGEKEPVMILSELVGGVNRKIAVSA